MNHRKSLSADIATASVAKRYQRICSDFPDFISEVVVLVVVGEQQLYLFKRGECQKSYRVSTSKFGVGNEENSLKTPLGAHCVSDKIGANLEKNRILKSRQETDRCATIVRQPIATEEDCITSRILWLSGLEPGYNQGGNVDSHNRYIYIHGTHEEGLLGQPASIGCVRMANEDIIELFDETPLNAFVYIDS